ncbi:MAG: class I SAM-dependent methyltransferase [Euryarchaeota archaeon]|nr:class I SAM-dependent methyltransferase [Euryarchaeota archaeon]
MEKPEHYRDDCNRIACIYDPLVRFISSFFGGEENLRRLTISKMNLKHGQKVLDVCCGTGTLCAMIAEVVGGDGEVVGVDLSENMLKKAENKSGDTIQFCYANAEKIPYADGYFDRASVTFGLHEMPHSVRMNVLREMRRMLKPGGRITVLDYSYPKRTLAMPLFKVWMLVEGDTARDFIRRDLSSMIRDAGFDVIEQNVYWMNTIRIVSGENVEIYNKGSGAGQ